MTHISRPQGQRIIPRLLNRFTDLEEILKCVRCKKPLALKYIFIVNNSQCGCIQWHTVTHTLICARILHQDRNSLRNRRQKSCGSQGRCLPHFHNVEEFLLGSQYFQGLNIGPVLIFRHAVQFQLDVLIRLHECLCRVLNHAFPFQIISKIDQTESDLAGSLLCSDSLSGIGFMDRTVFTGG